MDLLFVLCAHSRTSFQKLGPCDPVDPSNCMVHSCLCTLPALKLPCFTCRMCTCQFPFPNDFWLRGEQGNKRIAFNYTSLPKDNTGKVFVSSSFQKTTLVCLSIWGRESMHLLLAGRPLMASVLYR